MTVIGEPRAAPSTAGRGMPAPAGRRPARGLERLSAGVEWLGQRPLGVLVAYLVLALLAFPTLETLFLGRTAPHYALDVFDDGAVTRLGGLPGLWRDGGIALWNPLLAAGNAALGQFASTPFALDVQLARVIGPFAAYMLTLVLLAVVAGAGTHLFLRRSVHLGHLAAFAGGTVAAFGFWHYNLSFAAPALPLALWMADETLRGARVRWLPLLGWMGLAAFLFYNSHSQVTLLLGGVQLAFLAATARSRGALVRRAGVWGGVWALALLAYGPVLLTQLALLPESHRTLWARGAGPVDYVPVLRDLIAQYSPFLLGIRVGDGLGGTAHWFGTYFAGFVTLPALAAGVLAAREGRATRFLLLLLVIIPVADFLALTVVLQAQEHMGVLKSFQFSRVRLFFPFAVAANIAVGVQVLQGARRAGSRWRLLGSRALWIAFGVLIAAQGAAAARGLLYHLRRHGLQGPASEGVAAQVEGVGLLLAVALCGAAGSAWIALSLARHRGAGLPLSAAAAAALLAGTAVERAAFARVERYGDAAKLSTFEASLGETPALAFLKSQPNPGLHRVLTVGTWAGPNRVDHPNRMMFHGLRTADAYQNIYPLRYHDLFGVLAAPFLRTDSARYAYFHTWGNRAYAFGWPVDDAIADLIGIRWVVSRGVPIDEPGFVEVFAAGDERVYENRAVMPRAFRVRGARVFDSVPALLGALGAASADELRRNAYVERGSVGARPGAAGVLPGQASIVDYQPDGVIIESTGPDSGIVVLTDAYAAGWTATVDGAPALLFPVHRAFRGVAVPAGPHRVGMRYRPAEARRGVRLALVALLVGGAWTLAARAREAGFARRMRGVA